MQNIILAFAFDSYILYYPITLLADNEGPDQTAWMRRLIRVFAVRIYAKRRFRMALPEELYWTQQIDANKIKAAHLAVTFYLNTF